MLPSKKIITIALGCLIVLGVAVRNTVGQEKDSALTSTGNSVVAVQPTDTANVRTQLLNKVSANSSVDTGSSLTRNLSQDFAQNYIVLKNSGTLTTDNEAQLIQNLTTTYATTSAQSFTLRDISTFSDLDKEKTHTFGNNVAKTVITYYQSLKTSPVDIISADQNANSTTTVAAELSPIAKSYRMLALDLQKIPAPANEAANYLEIINGYAHLADDVDNMSVFFSDSVRGFIGINNYQQDSANQINLLKTAASYLAGNGILFSNTDSGKIWSSLTP